MTSCSTTLCRIATGTGWFAFFATLYFVPILLDGRLSASMDERVRMLLDDAMRTPAVRLEVLRNFLAGQILPLLPFFIVSMVAANRISAVSGLRRALVRAIVLLLCLGAMFSLNSRLFPHSQYRYVFESTLLGDLVWVLGLLFSAAVLYGIAGWLTRRRLAWVSAGAFTAAAGIAACLTPGAGPAGAARAGADGRHVIVIGIDSLSASLYERHRGAFPNIAGLLERSQRFDQAYTPLGRTFPAWVSFLTGRSPAETGAVFNLRSLEGVDATGSIAHRMRAQGYRTVFGMDERRFSHMDESFGFDRVVGPQAGALDFLLQPWNDTPLGNLLLQSPVSHYLLPFSRINVASHANYDAAGFVKEIEDASSGAQRLFLAVHFESSHFPFKTRHAKARIKSNNSFLADHLAALTVVDEQVGGLMAWLQRNGYLDDALVVVLSDHGEGLGEMEFRTKVNDADYPVQVFGHGTSLLSDHANRIVLGFLQFRNGEVANRTEQRKDLMSLTDVGGVIDMFRQSGGIQFGEARECMIVETGIRLTTTADYRSLNEKAVAAESARFYRIDARGRMVLREDTLGELIATKDVGVRCLDRITYWSFNDKQILAFRFEAAGQGLTQIAPRQSDVEAIASYFKRLMGGPPRDFPVPSRS